MKTGHGNIRISNWPMGKYNLIELSKTTCVLIQFLPSIEKVHTIPTGQCYSKTADNIFQFYYKYKKVLLRERKRHTAHRVASTPYVVLNGYPPSRVPPWSWPGGGYSAYLGTPQQGTPQQGMPPGRYPPGWTWQGTPPGVCPMAFWEMLQSIMGYGYPPPRCGQTNKVKLLPSRGTTYAGGKSTPLLTARCSKFEAGL